MTPLATTLPAYGDVLLRLAIDVAAMAILTYVIYFRRHRRGDLLVIYAMFNIGLFLALVVIAGGKVGMGVGFGLFAVLSIIRLRSEPFSHAEMAYFFVALVLALINGIDLGSIPFALMLDGVALAAALVIDHPRLIRPSRQLEVTLELVFADADALRRHLEERLNARIVDARVLEVDYVRETTRVAVCCLDRPPVAPPTLEAPHAGFAANGR
jgi:hypothetical protein